MDAGAGRCGRLEKALGSEFVRSRWARGCHRSSDIYLSNQVEADRKTTSGRPAEVNMGPCAGLGISLETGCGLPTV